MVRPAPQVAPVILAQLDLLDPKAQQAQLVPQAKPVKLAPLAQRAQPA